MERIASELKDIETTLADKETYDTMPKDELDALLKNSGRLRQRMEASEEEWLELQDSLEA